MRDAPKRRRRLVAFFLIGLGAVCAVTAVVLGLPFWVAFTALLVAWLGAAYAVR